MVYFFAVYHFFTFFLLQCWEITILFSPQIRLHFCNGILMMMARTCVLCVIETNYADNKEAPLKSGIL